MQRVQASPQGLRSRAGYLRSTIIGRRLAGAMDVKAGYFLCFRVSQRLTAASGCVLITFAFVNQPLRALPTPTR